MKEVDEKERFETQEKINLEEGIKIKFAKGLV